RVGARLSRRLDHDRGEDRLQVGKALPGAIQAGADLPRQPQRAHHWTAQAGLMPGDQYAMIPFYRCPDRLHPPLARELTLEQPVEGQHRGFAFGEKVLWETRQALVRKVR